ncbi:hypothetical protein [Kitasatospora phosalacinea]|uniref:Uncharacterized protein n=1 Tax=Kitasatospora phosalacinea TaxID=2065 RepID=A0A9W6PN52_9ACTN|nr:hypothetical protein [Kitasatospora phosalacinea]GLW59499.1 hypothetical protein Kpho01_75090 [Kitasatospora phosalacinea]
MPHSPGATETVVDLLRRDHLRMRVTAVDPAGAGANGADKAPLLTLDQLKSLALDPAWAALGTK